MLAHPSFQTDALAAVHAHLTNSLDAAAQVPHQYAVRQRDAVNYSAHNEMGNKLQYSFLFLSRKSINLNFESN